MKFPFASPSDMRYYLKMHLKKHKTASAQSNADSDAVKSMGHIFISNSARNCISSKRSFAYHQGECLAYHQREADTPSVMIYAYGDDIQPVG